MPTTRSTSRVAHQAPPAPTMMVIVLHPPLIAQAPRPKASSVPEGGGGSTLPLVATPEQHEHRAQRDSPEHQRTLTALAVAQRDLHTYTLEAQGAALGAEVPPGGLTAMSRRAEFLAKRVKVMSVIADLSAGASWQTIGARLGRSPEECRAIYEPMARAWAAGSLAPWAPSLGPEVPPGTLVGLMPIEVGEHTRAHLMPYLWAQGRAGALRTRPN